jgi:hypothetical protein
MLMNCFWMTPLGRSLDVILRHVPLGDAWDAFRTTGKRAFRFLAGVSQAYEDAWAALCNLATELNPFSTNQLITDWQTAVGLPDPCLWQATTPDQIRAQIVYRLTKTRWTTAAEWHALAALFGLTIRITPGWYVQKPCLYPFEYPRRYDLFPRLGRFRVYIDVYGLNYYGYPYGGTSSNSGPGYPIPYGTNPALLPFQCIINRVKPANVVVIWNDNPLYNYCVAETFSSSYSDTYCSESIPSS